MQTDRRIGIVSATARALRSPWLPIACALLTVAAVVWMWDGLAQPGAFHDERAYLVQARLLAQGAWTAAAPPMPIFWAMPHVYVEPALFAKYPPGFAPLLVPGLWLGVPGLVPALLAGLSAALIVVLVRRIAGAGTALLAWALWTSAAQTMDWHASYLSETASVPLFLSALLALHGWSATRSRASLVALTACVGWLGITRPVTGIALTIPIAVVVLSRAARERQLVGWRSALLVGLAIASLVPYWSWRTTGSPRRMPYSEYSQEYFPFDMPGFTRDTSPPRRPLPPDFVALGAAVSADYAPHRPSRIPAYLVQRSANVLSDAIGRFALPAAVLVPIGLAVLGGGIAALVVSSTALMLLAYTLMPHPPTWTLYYLELFPLLAAAAAVALTALARRVRRVWPVVAIGVVLLVGNLSQWPTQRVLKATPTARQRLAQLMIAELEDPRAVIFVRRSPALSPHFTLWDILGPPATTDTWILRDLGAAADRELLQSAGGRRPYLLDETTMTLVPWDPAGAEPAPHQAMP